MSKMWFKQNFDVQNVKVDPAKYESGFSKIWIQQNENEQNMKVDPAKGG